MRNRSGSVISQNKAAEKEFFARHASKNDYDVFTQESNDRLSEALVQLAEIQTGDRIVDIGCGSGVFTNGLHRRFARIFGLDLSLELLRLGKQSNGELDYLVGDAERLPLKNESVDVVILSGIIHHFRNPRQLIGETFRILKPGGRFVAFDPNRKNPFMWLFRDLDSPFYVKSGVTENERPILARQTVKQFEKVGLEADCKYMTLKYRYVGSSILSLGIPIYNRLEDFWASAFPGFEKHRALILTFGKKTRNFRNLPGA